MVMEQLDQFLLPIETEGYEKFSVGIVYPFRTHRVTRNNLTIQSTIFQYNQATGWGKIDQYYFTLSSLKSYYDVWSGGSRGNIDNRTKVNPQGPLGTIIPETNSLSNSDIFNSVRKTSDISDRIVSWNVEEKIESENLGGNNFFENAER